MLILLYYVIKYIINLYFFKCYYRPEFSCLSCAVFRIAKVIFLLL